MKLVIATPVDGDATTGQVAAGYASALANLSRDNGALLDIVPAQVTYSYDICRARNRVAAMVLRDLPTATHVLWWDSDVVPHDLSVIRHMLATGHDVIAAPYLRKRHPLTWTHLGGAEGASGDPVVEVEAVPFGFTITSVACLQRMTVRYADELGYTDVRNDGSIASCVGLFNLAWRSAGPGSRTLLSEDYSFCQRWRDMGGTVYLYTGDGSSLSHVGNHAWRSQ